MGRSLASRTPIREVSQTRTAKAACGSLKCVNRLFCGSIPDELPGYTDCLNVAALESYPMENIEDGISTHIKQAPFNKSD